MRKLFPLATLTAALVCAGPAAAGHDFHGYCGHQSSPVFRSPYTGTSWKVRFVRHIAAPGHVHRVLLLNNSGGQWHQAGFWREDCA